MYSCIHLTLCPYFSPVKLFGLYLNIKVSNSEIEDRTENLVKY